MHRDVLCDSGFRWHRLRSGSYAIILSPISRLNCCYSRAVTRFARKTRVGDKSPQEIWLPYRFTKAQNQRATNTPAPGFDRQSASASNRT